MIDDLIEFRRRVERRPDIAIERIDNRATIVKFAQAEEDVVEPPHQNHRPNPKGLQNLCIGTRCTAMLLGHRVVRCRSQQIRQEKFLFIPEIGIGKERVRPAREFAERFFEKGLTALGHASNQ